MNTKAKPGLKMKWRVAPDLPSIIETDEDSPCTIAGVSAALTTAELRRVARLIAQAPAMYEALMAIQEWLLFTESITESRALWNQQFLKANDLTCAVIASVEGKEKP